LAALDFGLRWSLSYSTFWQYVARTSLFFRDLFFLRRIIILIGHSRLPTPTLNEFLLLFLSSAPLHYAKPIPPVGSISLTLQVFV
jgi:hypothetical protein